MSSKRSPQTAAKRAREQAVREKRELKAEKKRAVIEARKLGELPVDPDAEVADESEDEVEVADAIETTAPRSED